MKDNEKYTFENTSNSQITHFEKGCVVDADILFTEILGSCFLQNKYVDLEKSKKIHLNRKAIVKISRNLTVEIKVKPRKKRIYGSTN